MISSDTHTDLVLPRVVHRRKSYEDRTGLSSRAARITLKAVNAEFIYTEDGVLQRVWKPEEMQSYKNEDIRKWLLGNRVVEADTALQYVPPSAVKYAITKGWIRKDLQGRPFFWITKAAAIDLGLPKPVVSGVTCDFVK